MCFKVKFSVLYWQLQKLFLNSIAKNLQEFPVFGMDNIFFSKNQSVNTKVLKRFGRRNSIT